MTTDADKPVTRGEFRTAMEKIDAHFEKIDARFERIDVRFKKSDVRFKESDAWFKKSDVRFKESDAWFKKSDARFKESDAWFKKSEEYFRRNDELFKKSDERIRAGEKMLWTEIHELEEKMYTKEDHAKFMVWMDEAMTELRDTRVERKLSGQQVLRLDDKVVDHEKRISSLENGKLCSN